MMLAGRCFVSIVIFFPFSGCLRTLIAAAWSVSPLAGSTVALAGSIHQDTLQRARPLLHGNIVIVVVLESRPRAVWSNRASAPQR
jgi:hypothetical protein